MKYSRSSWILAAIALIWLLAFSQGLIQIQAYKIVWLDLINDVFLLCFCLLMLIGIWKLDHNHRAFPFLYWGFLLFFVGQTHNLLGIFFQLESLMITFILKNLSTSIGLILIAKAVYTWVQDFQAQIDGLEQEKIDLAVDSSMDALSNLFNRGFFDQILDYIVQEKLFHSSYCLLLIDLDNFKHHNDTYGHLEGDKVIMVCGRLINRLIRRSDYGFRVGGEEFAVLIEGQLDDAHLVAERIRQQFAETAFEVSPTKQVYKTLSMGLIALNPHETALVQYNKADQALYQAKQTGKNRIVVVNADPKINQQLPSNQC